MPSTSSVDVPPDKTQSGCKERELLQNPTSEYKPSEVTVTDILELWYDKNDISVVSRVEKNRPDLILWDKKHKTCKIIEVTVPLDSNLSAAYMQK